jgi:hypothetical protein
MFDKFKNLIFKEEESTKETTPVVNVSTKETPTTFSPSPVVNTSQPTYNISNNSEEITKYQNIIKDVLNENNLDGIDYYEFMNSIKSMDSTGTPENLKYKLAFSSLNSVDNKLTKELLISAATHYVEVINKTVLDFNNSVDQKFFKISEQKKEKSIELENQILQLQEQINQLNIEKNNNLTESIELRNKGNEKVNYFKMIADSEIETINSNSKKIQEYI